MTITLNRRQALAGLSALALPACRSSDKGFDADIIILGAGLSGLHAARLLSAEGRDVLVLEGSDRIGGRLHTLDHGDRHYTEGGGEQVGASYARIIDTAQQVGVTLLPDASASRQTAYYYQDRLYGPDEWKNAEEHPFEPPFKGASPASPLFGLAARHNPLTSPTDWRDPKFEPFDISADQFLRDSGLGDEARRVIGVALNGNSLDSYSMINLYRTLQLFAQSRDMGPSLAVQGGAQRLPEAMAASLLRKVQTGEMIKSISVTSTAVNVTTSRNQTFIAPHCISTLPFSVMSNLTLSAPLNAAQTAATAQLPYTQIYQIHFRARKPFWEQDNLPADMWTDSPIERIFAEHDDDGNPTGVFRAWINGTTAQNWTSQAEPKGLFRSVLKKIRPASDEDVKILAMQNWTQSNPLAGGAYMHWAPGQISGWAGDMAKPAGRLFFAGEHLSYLHTGMEGAMESAENAAFSLMDI